MGPTVSWLRIDDGFAAHPKVTQLTDSQKWVWMRTLCYCARYEDPSLDFASVKEISGLKMALVLRLVEVGLLDKSGGGWEIHDWADYQPKDRTGAERQARWRNRRNGEVTGATVTEDVTKTSLARARPRPVIRTSLLPTSTVNVAPGKSLEIGKELLVTRLLAAVGNADESRADYIRGAARRLPEAVVAGLLELVASGRARDRVAYVCGALRAELERQEVA